MASLERSVDSEQGEVAGPAGGPVGRWAAISVVVASMIGTGIFTTTGFLVGTLGVGPGVDHAVVWVWVLGGLLALCGASVYAELGALFPRSGGEYVYLARAFHPVVGVMSGLVSLLVGFSAPVAASALAFARYVHTLAPATPELPVALALIAAVAALHGTDVARGGRVQGFMTGLKLVLLIVFVVGGLLVAPTASATTAAAQAVGPGIGAHAVALVLVSYSYSGWNAAAYVAGEMRRPERTLPLALLVGTSIVTLLYVGLNLVYFRAASPAELAGVLEVGHLAAERLFGPSVGGVLTGLVGLALASSVSSMLMAGPRVSVAMAEDGYLPRALAVRTARGAPSRAVLLQAGLAALVAATATVDRILYSVGFLLGLVAAATVLAAVVLRVREGARPRPFRAPGWPVTPALFLLLSVGMAGYGIAQRPGESVVAVGVLIALGLIAFRLRRS